MTMDRKDAARALRSVAALLELHGENPHRVRAFANAARSIERLEGDLEELVTSGRILEVKGVGRGTAAFLRELLEGRTPALLQDLMERTPEGVRELLRVRGLGPKRVRALWRELGIQSPGELEYACLENRLVELPGFGPASQASVLEAVRFLLRARERWLVDEAWSEAEGLVRELGAGGGVDRVVVAGELRRGSETVGSLELVLVGGGTAGAVLEGCGLKPVLAGGALWEGRTEGGLPVRVTVAPPSAAGAALVAATGSGAHLEALERRAASGGLRLAADGLFSGDERVAGEDEEGIYDRLGLQWVPPELREGEGELERAAAGGLPELVTAEDIRGALHNHTSDSDGTATVEEMARAALELGWSWLGIADHSPAAHYANGLDAERLGSQAARIAAWNAGGEGRRLRVFSGLEADILPDGTLDVPEGCGECLDHVVASVHSAFHLDREAQTRRILAAVRDPRCRVLGHPTGRLLLARPGYALDLEAVLQACAEHGVAVEINANPHRLDLDWRNARRALELGVKLVIDPDAHATGGLADLRWGLAVARKAGAARGDLLNTLDDPLGA